MARFFKSSLFLYMMAVVASFVGLQIVLSYHQPVNVDGIVNYFVKAKIILDHGLKEALADHQWLFYPFLIATLSKITHLSFLSSVRIIDFFHDTFSFLFFLMLLKEISGSRRVQWIGLFAFFFFPALFHIRDMVIRDHGYLCYSLLSLWCFIRYARSEEWKYAIAWGLSNILATLFRIEGIFHMLVPLILLWKPQCPLVHRWKLFLKAYCVPMAGFLGGLLGLLFVLPHTHHTASEYLGRLVEVANQWLHGGQYTLSAIQTRAAIVSKFILPIDSGYSSMFVISGLVTMFMDHVISAIEVAYLFFAGYALYHRKECQIRWEVVASWSAFVFIHLWVVFFFLSQQFFLVGRYVLWVGALFVLMAPSGIDYAYQSWKERKGIWTSRWVILLACVGLLYIAISAVGFYGPSRTYDITAGQWVNQNLPRSAKIYTNDIQLAYHADPSHDRNIHLVMGVLGVPDAPIPASLLPQYDYFALNIGRHDAAMKEHLNRLPLVKIKAFYNRHGDQVVIFKTRRQ